MPACQRALVHARQRRSARPPILNFYLKLLRSDIMILIRCWTFDPFLEFWILFQTFDPIIDLSNIIYPHEYIQFATSISPIPSLIPLLGFIFNEIYFHIDQKYLEFYNTFRFLLQKCILSLCGQFLTFEEIVIFPEVYTVFMRSFLFVWGKIHFPEVCIIFMWLLLISSSENRRVYYLCGAFICIFRRSTFPQKCRISLCGKLLTLSGKHNRIWQNTCKDTNQRMTICIDMHKRR